MTVWVVTYRGTGMLALAYAYTTEAAAQKAMDSISMGGMRLRKLEVVDK